MLTKVFHPGGAGTGVDGGGEAGEVGGVVPASIGGAGGGVVAAGAGAWPEAEVEGAGSEGAGSEGAGSEGAGSLFGSAAGASSAGVAWLSLTEEFEHNVTQQVYVSDRAWQQVKMAKEETLRIINIAAEGLGDTANGTALSQRVFETAGKLSHLPTQQAIAALKEEVRKLF